MADRTEPKKKMQVHSDLFQPARLGPYQLANRIVMAPLTRVAPAKTASRVY